jgi:predicted transcriptional regulator
MVRQAKNTKKVSGVPEVGSGWTFLTNHAHVLLCLAGNPEMRLRDVAEQVGITERSVQSIVHELEAAGAITRQRVGRRNRYELHPDHRLHHPIESHCVVGDLIDMVLKHKKRKTVKR